MNATPELKVFKIGGNVVDTPEALEKFIEEFARIEEPKILVHGGGKEATRLSARLGIETTMIDGRRVTDRPTLDVCTMVYAGLVNKRIVALLQANGCNAIGLSGCDAAVLPASRRPARPIDYGFVGDIDSSRISVSAITMLLRSGLTPVFCAIAYDGNGSLLNCNADSVASSIAIAMSPVNRVELTYCFERNGVLANIDNPDSVIPRIDRDSYSVLLEDKIIADGMIPKIDNAFRAIERGVDSVVIRNSKNIDLPAGTTIR